MTTRRPRVLFVIGNIEPPGGGSGFSAWALQVLAEDCDVLLLTREAIDREKVDRFFGTRLVQARFEQRIASSWILDQLRRFPFPLALLHRIPLAREQRRLDAEQPFDLLISLDNEFDFGRRGLQVIHFPWLYWPRPQTDLRVFHRSETIVRIYRWIALRLADVQRERIARNLAFANSSYIAGLYRETFGVEAGVLFPPVAAGLTTETEWSERSNGFLCVGRIAKEKLVPEVIGIIEAVRRRGHDVSLGIVGQWDCSRARRLQIERMIDERRDWITLHQGLDRDELLRLMDRYRYGIHGMVGEHFGMSVAELQRSGCLVFAPALGGPAEILGGDEGLRYRNSPDAVEKIDRVLRDAALRCEMLEAMRARRHEFDIDRFSERLRAILRAELPALRT